MPAIKDAFWGNWLTLCFPLGILERKKRRYDRIVAQPFRKLLIRWYRKLLPAKRVQSTCEKKEREKPPSCKIREEIPKFYVCVLALFFWSRDHTGNIVERHGRQTEIKIEEPRESANYTVTDRGQGVNRLTYGESTDKLLLFFLLLRFLFNSWLSAGDFWKFDIFQKF